MLRLLTSGRPFERGRSQGRACAGRVKQWMEPVRRRWTGPETEDLRRRAGLARQQLARADPDGHEECCGLAEGLGMTEEEYFEMVAGYRLRPPACTVLGFRTGSGVPCLGKTDDLEPFHIGANVFEIVTPDTGYRHAQIHFSGTIWTVAGMNEPGLAFGMTGIPGPSPGKNGLWSLDALHTLLPVCADVPELVARVRALRLSSGGFSLLAGDARGRMTLLEKTAAGTVVLPNSKDGCLLHTNHVLDPEFAARNPPQPEPLNTNSRRRFERARAALPALPRTRAGMRSFVGDTVRQTGQDGLMTDCSLIFAPISRRLECWVYAQDPKQPPDFFETVSPWKE